MAHTRQKTLSLTDESVNPSKIVILLAAPALFEGLSRVATQYVDTAMVGSLGSYATAAVGINMSVLFLLWGIMQAVATAFSVMLAQSIGASDRGRGQSIIKHAMVAAVLFGILLSAAMLLLGGVIPLWLGAADEVAPSAIAYLRIVGGASLFQSASVVVSGLLRAAGNTKTPFVVNLLANLFNIVCNIILIPQPYVLSIGSLSVSMYGAGLGVEGAAIATAGSFAFSAVLMTVLFKRANPGVRLFGAFRPDTVLLREALSLGVPVAFERIVLAIGQIILTAMVAYLGTRAIAAHYVANSISTLAFETATGFSIASTTIIAQCKGACKPALAHTYMLKSLKIGVAVTLVFSAAVFIGASLFAQLFTIDAQVAADATVIVRLDAVFEPVFAVAIVLCGVFRGYGDTRFPFIVSVVGFLGTRLIFGFLLGYLFGLGLLGIWIAIMLDIVTRTLMCAHHMRKI